MNGPGWHTLPMATLRASRYDRSRMRNRVRRKATRSPKSTAAPITEQSSSRGIWLGAVLGVVGTLIAQAVVSYTPLFDSSLVVQIDEPPDLTYDDRQIVGGKDVSVLSASVKVRNSGLRSGSLSRAELTPLGTYDLPKIELVDLDRGPIGPFTTRSVQVQFRITFPGIAQHQETFKFDLFDDANRQVGSIVIEGWTPPLGPPTR